MTAQTKSSPSKADVDAITNVAMDYILGWFQGDAERIGSSFHPDMAKRGVSLHPKTGRTLVSHLSADIMVERARAGDAPPTPEEDLDIEITVVDVYHDIATAIVMSKDYADYLHLVKANGEWGILNVLWRRTV
jgi:hypothetical protein